MCLYIILYIFVYDKIKGRMIQEFNTYFQAQAPIMQMYWVIAIFSSVVFIVQMALSFIGLGDAGDASDVDVSFDGDSGGDALDHSGAMHLLSIRNVIYFMLGFGWSGISFHRAIDNQFLLGIVSILMGCTFVAIFLALFRQMRKLESNGAFDINDSVGKVCQVYMRIPADGMGKVQVSFNGSIQELDARSTSPDPIPSGAKVRVTAVVGRVLIVEEA